MNNVDWKREFDRMLKEQRLTMRKVRKATSSLVHTLSQDQAAKLAGADLEHPELMNEDQVGVFRVLMFRAWVVLSVERAERQRQYIRSQNT